MEKNVEQEILDSLAEFTDVLTNKTPTKVTKITLQQLLDNLHVTPGEWDSSSPVGEEMI